MTFWDTEWLKNPYKMLEIQITCPHLRSRNTQYPIGCCEICIGPKLELQNLAYFTTPRKRLTSSQMNSLVSRISGFLTGNFASHLTIMIVDVSISSATWTRKPNASRFQACLQVNGESLNRHWKEVHRLHHLADPPDVPEDALVLKEIEMESAE
jgi:hypothetical protein